MTFHCNKCFLFCHAVHFSAILVLCHAICMDLFLGSQLLFVRFVEDFVIFSIKVYHPPPYRLKLVLLSPNASTFSDSNLFHVLSTSHLTPT